MENSIFISYRRQDGFYPAFCLYKELTENGYNAFFDIKSIRRGEFPDIIRYNIETCIDFILIITKTTFSERIFDENDWIRREVSLAIENKKNIITLFIDSSFPDVLPSDIERIRYYNGIKQNDPNLLEETYQRLFKDFLISTPITEYQPKLVRRCSIYSADYGDEPQRLELQAKNTFNFDMSVLNKINISGAVLDVGCAFGNVTVNRFSDQRYTRIVGIDKSDACIKKASTIGGKFQFGVIDVEGKDFTTNMNELTEKVGIKEFNLIYIALVLHHLSDPYKVLRNLRKYLSNNGYIFIRGVDDGSKMCYPDENKYLTKIIDKTLKAPGTGDRLHGRKIYDWLKQSGYHNIQIFSDMRDTSNISYDERENMFQESFSYRINNYRKAWEAEPSNQDSYKNFDEMENLLALFENEFMKESFWYGESDFIGVATKNGN